MLTEDQLNEVLNLPHYVTRKGHAVIYMPSCPLAWSNGQIRRSRYVAWSMGLLTGAEQIVHHKDENKLNDCPENLEVLSRAEHQRHHLRNPTEQSHENRSLAQRGKTYSAETRAKISKSLRGKTNASGPRSGQALENIAAANQKRYAAQWERDQPMVERMRAMRRAGMTYEQIGKIENSSWERVSRILRRFGV